MQRMEWRIGRSFRLWTWWLVCVAGAALAFGTAVVFAPGLTGRVFGGLYLSDPDAIAAFGPGAAHYIAFVTAVMGAVMAGWATAILLVVAFRFRPGNRDAWWVIAGSVLVWCVLDTAYSLQTGFWQNAVFNVGALVLFLIPLAATYRACNAADAHLTSAST